MVRCSVHVIAADLLLGTRILCKPVSVAIETLVDLGFRQYGTVDPYLFVEIVIPCGVTLFILREPFRVLFRNEMRL